MNPIFSSLGLKPIMNSVFKCIQSTKKLKSLNPLNINNAFANYQVRFAGHSKWQNIRHTKGAKDQEKATMFALLSKKIKLAVADGGGPDPKLNYRLANVIEQAKKVSMPTTTIENAIKSTQVDKNKAVPHLLEIKGPRNAMIIVSCLTTNKSLCKQSLSSIVRKSTVMKWLEGGSALSKFEVKGQIYAKIPSDMTNPEETTVDDGIEVGAEEVNKSEVEEDHYEFITTPADMIPIKTKLEKKNYIIVRAEIEYIPTELAVLDDEELVKVSEGYKKLEAHPDVVHIYDNIECSS